MGCGASTTAYKEADAPAAAPTPQTGPSGSKQPASTQNTGPKDSTDLKPGSAPVAPGSGVARNLSLQERILAQIVPGDVLARNKLQRKALDGDLLKTLRGAVRYQVASEAFPLCSVDTDQTVVDYEQKAAALAGGTFNAEPGEGKTPPADPELAWERGYLLGEAAHEIIPLLIARLPDSELRPVAILLHGTGSSKEKMIPHISTYAKQGFMAVSMDHRYLGERSMSCDLNQDLALVDPSGAVNLGEDNANLAQRLAVWARLSRPARLASYQVAMKKSALGESLEHPFVFDSAWDVVRVIDYLATRPDVKREGGEPIVGLMGISLGGMVTQLAAGGDLRVRASAPMISLQCFELQKDWKMWAPRVKTLQIPFKAVAERDGYKVEDVEGQCNKATNIRNLRLKLNEDFFDKLGVKDQMVVRDQLVEEDDKFMRSLGVDEKVVEKVYAAMNPGLLDGDLDGPQVMRALAPRPLLITNAAAGQRCPAESIYQVFHESKNSWTKLGKGRDMRLYLACQPILHHSDREDLHLLINQFLRKHILNEEDADSQLMSECSDEGKQIEPVPGQTGWIFTGKEQVLDDDTRVGLTFQEQIMSKIVPGDVLARNNLSREKLVSGVLQSLRSKPNYLQVPEPFPEYDGNCDELCVEYEKKAAALAGGEFNAEPGEGKVPPADPELHWERGYLLGDAPHEIIPLLIAKPKDDVARPAVIMLHGTGSSKEKMIPHLTDYAKAGFFAISMDHRYLGERSMTPELNPDIAMYTADGNVNLGEGLSALALRLNVWPKLSRPTRLASYQVAMKMSALGESLEHPFVFNSAWDVIRIVDYLAIRDDVKKIRGDPYVGLWGISLGGMVTQLAAASDIRIEAAAPMISVQCFELQRDWKMWAPRCKTLQIPFKAVAEKMGLAVEDVEASCKKASDFRKVNVELNEDFFDKLGIKNQILGPREDLIEADDRFMRELGVDERAVTATYDMMNPHLLDGLLDGPESLQAIAPRPLLMCNAGAGQRCPVEAVWDTFKSTRDSWQDFDAGHNLLLYVACQPIIHHAVAPDFLVLILQFMRKHLLGAKDSEAAAVLAKRSKHGVALEPVAGYRGMLFAGSTAIDGEEEMPVEISVPQLSVQEKVLSQIVPGDVLARKKMNRKKVTGRMLKALRGAVRYQAVSEAFPECSADTDEIVVEYEKKAAALAGGTFNAEPGEGKTPPADPELVWERGYLLGEGAHEIIPLLIAKLGDDTLKPAAIILHGTGSSKEKMIPHISKYAKQGFMAVSMDHRYLGERSMNFELNQDLALVTADGAVNLGEGNANLAQRLAVWARLSRPARLASYQVAMKNSALGESLEHPFVYDSAWDVVRVVDYLATRPDVKRLGGEPVVGLMGVSLGGMVTQLAAGGDVRIKAAAPMISLQCFDLQKNWKMWAPRVKTLQIPFKAVAERDGCKVEDVEAQCEKATTIRNLRLTINEDLFEKLGVKDQMVERDALVAQDDNFMRSLGVDEGVVEKVYAAMNPGLLDGDLDGPQVMRALAPRPLLITNAAAGQRCPAESIYQVFSEAKNSWTKFGKGRDMRLYLACQPILHHSDREDLHLLINEFLRKHILGEDLESRAFADCDDDGKEISPVPGQSGWLFSGKEQELDEYTRDGLTFQDQIMTNLVPGDVLERNKIPRSKLRPGVMKSLRGRPTYFQVPEPFPQYSGNSDELCVEYEKRASELAGGEFNAEPGEGKVPPADPELHWERGYLLGHGPHEIIPLLIAKPKDDVARPAVIMLHGTGSSKEKMIPFLTEYAKAGFFAISMDHRYLGERSMIPELNSDIAMYTSDGNVNLGDGLSALALRLDVWPKLSRPTRLAAYQVAMKKSALGETLEHPFVFNSAWDVIRIVDYLATRDDVKKKGADACVGLWGISLGGMVTQLVAASDTRIQAAAPMISVQCFELQRDWKMWAPRCKTLQIPFKAVAEKMGVSATDVETACEKASSFRKVNATLNEDLFDNLGIKDQIMGPREELIAADDRFMRELGVDEKVVTATYDMMNPHLLDGLLDGPESLQAIAPRPLLFCNAGAGQRCPIEAVWDVFKSTRDSWHDNNAGQDLLLYVACQPMIHHAVAPDFLVMILQFMRKYILKVNDSETEVLTHSSKSGKKLEPVPGYTGMLFRGDNEIVDF